MIPNDRFTCAQAEKTRIGGFNPPGSVSPFIGPDAFNNLWRKGPAQSPAVRINSGPLSILNVVARYDVTFYAFSRLGSKKLDFASVDCPGTS